MKRSLILFLAIAVAGCKPVSIPNPNSAEAAEVEGKLAQLALASEAANKRVARGELTPDQARELVVQRAQELAKGVDPEQATDGNAYRYGELFRSAQMWQEAATVLKRASETAKGEERRVVDTLHYARALVGMGQVGAAVKASDSVLDTTDADSAPVLPAILLEIVPNARGKGFDPELAQLLIDAVPLHLKTVVNPEAPEGKAFLMARQHHCTNAYNLAIELLMDSGKPERAEEAARLRQRFLENSQSL